MKGEEMDGTLVVFGFIGLYIVILGLALAIGVMFAETKDNFNNYLGSWLFTAFILACVITASIAVAKGWI